MIQNYNSIHPAFKLNGISYAKNELISHAKKLEINGLEYEKEIGIFLLEWLNNKRTIEVKTSGSTGTPKLIELQKLFMKNSAMSTGEFFQLNPGDRALHCLPSKFIAGKMMLVRALVLGLEIDTIQPSTILNIDDKKEYDFCAMVPMQLEKSILYCNQIKNIIVGGTSVNIKLKKDIQSIPSQVFETYGMTETITHIAIKKINHSSIDEYFNVLSDVSVSIDSRSCLIINAPNISPHIVVTNDVVKLHSDKKFEWLARYDNVINSGGIKLYPEQIELKLQESINCRFFVASEKDDVLGVRLILILESEINNLDISILETLDKYEIPKHIYTVKKFSETSSGKINRQKTLKQVFNT